MPFPSLADLPDPGIGLMFPAFAGRFFPAEPPEKPRLDPVLKVKKKKSYKEHFFNEVTNLKREWWYCSNVKFTEIDNCTMVFKKIHFTLKNIERAMTSVTFHQMIQEKSVCVCVTHTHLHTHTGTYTQMIYVYFTHIHMSECG